MSNMNVEQIRNLETSEIENQVKDLKQQLFTLRFQHATGQLENPNVPPTTQDAIVDILGA